MLVKVYPLLHAGLKNLPDVGLRCRATVPQAIETEVAVTFLESKVTKQGLPREDPIRKHGTERACTKYDRR